jgi:endonuclease/exonuclease/phosphatase family metal-dependent hydrolase
MRRPTAIGAGVLVLCLPYLRPAEGAVIRVVAYNTFNNPNDDDEDDWFASIFRGIAAESVRGVARRPDIIAVSETDTGSSARLVDILNGLYGLGTYDIVVSSSYGGDKTGIVYDVGSLVLLGSCELAEDVTHPMVRAHFRPVGLATANCEFYVYAVQLKSGPSGADEATRTAEAACLREDADLLGEGENIIYAGDFNMTGSLEGAWAGMAAAGNGQAFDAADAPGEWRDNESFKWLHSHSSREPMDDRFDLQFISGELLDHEGMDYSRGSYHVFGNNATHALDGPISTGSGAAPSVLAALEAASDHLPVVADYWLAEPAQLPGDADRDGDVDFWDYVTAKDSFGKAGRYWEDGDFDGDGDVDFLDYATLKRSYGTRASSEVGERDTSAVPEPAVFALLAAGALTLAGGRKPSASGTHRGRYKPPTCDTSAR